MRAAVTILLRSLAAIVLVTLVGGGRAYSASDAVRIVGSSSMYAFASKVAEVYGQNAGTRAPVIESTGTGGGIKIFCKGVGMETVDIATASRPMTAEERRLCAANGVTAIRERAIGYDGIVLAQPRRTALPGLTRRQLWLAMAERVPIAGRLQPNPYRSWSELDPTLPDLPIRIYGPPVTSGTRDVFAALVLDGGCNTFRGIRELSAPDRRTACRRLRRDGVYIEAGENDDMIVRRVAASGGALAIVSYNALERNRHLLRPTALEGVLPSYETIAWGTYPLSRKLRLYVKEAHFGLRTGLEGYVAEFTTAAAIGPQGYLTTLGLIPLTPDGL